jgi:ATP-dependent DNA helicase RecG
MPAGVKAKCKSLGLLSVSDFLLHLPLRYEDETSLTPLDDIEYGKPVHLEVEVTGHEISYKPRKTLKVQTVVGPLRFQLRFLNFYPGQLRHFEKGQRIRILGECRPGFQGAEFIHPRYHLVTEATPLAQSLTPIYPTTAGLSQAALRKWILVALDSPLAKADTLPQALLSSLGLPSLPEALSFLHRPPSGTPVTILEDRAHPAWQRLKFDELLAQQLSMQQYRRARLEMTGAPMPSGGPLYRALHASLPFTLTNGQRRALEDISADLTRPHPMQRLLQGDVGSGKTVVAALALAQAVDAGYQAVLLAPTEILATQHFSKIETWLQPLGIACQWYTGQQKKSERNNALERLKNGDARIIIGTHALLEEPVEFKKLGLAVIDEQHRFGVEQRLALKQKTLKQHQFEVHQLMMSATPIPRTLSMSFFADLDVSVIDELPPGRSPVNTRLMESHRRLELVELVRQVLDRHQQAYWVCPLIEESQALDLQTAMETYEELQAILGDYRVGLIHGRLPADQKAETMAAFKRGDIAVLVATTVIEVGVDVPNATLMVIEHAERMGLAQLHQLRGRVGRGSDQSWCVLLYYPPLSDTAKARLKVIYENTDGFEIARHDLRIRGPGEFLGARQSGAPLLRFADLSQDIALLENARGVATELITREPAIVEQHLKRWLGSRADYLRA